MTDAQPRGDAAPARLLVVDDNEMNRDLLSRRLRSRGYEVDEAPGGEAALAACAAVPYDAVLLDVMMPGLSGFEVLSRLRETRSQADLPVLMVTARDSREDVVAALELGANDYVTKPLDFAVVAARLKTHLALKFAGGEARRLATELARANRFVRKVFGRYVSADVVESLLDTPGALALGGERRFVALLLADLRGFAAVSESLAPEAVVRVLNNYLGAMADVIVAHGGTIDEFVGDGILALFGAPFGAADDARRAARCALAMQARLGDVNGANRAEGLPEVEMGVAINAGEVIVGNIGSELRAKYGVVGSHVNLTGRLETFAVGGQILATEALLAAAGEGTVTGRPFTISAKGFREPIAVRELLGIRGEEALSLPDPAPPPAPLAVPAPVRVSLLLDKRDSEAFEASLLALSRREALLLAPEPPEFLSNLRIRIGPAEAYGKVIGEPDSRGAVMVRFTGVPADAAEALARIARPLA